MFHTRVLSPSPGVDFAIVQSMNPSKYGQQKGNGLFIEEFSDIDCLIWGIEILGKNISMIAWHSILEVFILHF